MASIKNLLDLTCVAEYYLLALCESDRKKEILQLLESMDITKFSSPDYIFRCLGRLLLESFAEKFLLEFKACGMLIINIFSGLVDTIICVTLRFCNWKYI